MPSDEKARSPTSQKQDIPGLACPRCGKVGRQWVIDSRPTGSAIKRRRECVCGFRFNSYETLNPPNEVMLAEVRRDLIYEIKSKLTEGIKQVIADSFKEET